MAPRAYVHVPQPASENPWPRPLPGHLPSTPRLRQPAFAADCLLPAWDLPYSYLSSESHMPSSSSSSFRRASAICCRCRLMAAGPGLLGTAAGAGGGSPRATACRSSSRSCSARGQAAMMAWCMCVGRSSRDSASLRLAVVRSQACSAADSACTWLDSLAVGGGGEEQGGEADSACTWLDSLAVCVWGGGGGGGMCE